MAAYAALVYWGSNVIKYLRKHLEEAMAGPTNGSDEPSWALSTEGTATVATWPEREGWDGEPPERVWEIRIYCRRVPLVIGRGE